MDSKNLSVRGQFEELLHNTLTSYGFKGGLVQPYKIKFVLGDISVHLEGKYYSSMFFVYKGEMYEFNSISEMLNHRIMKSKIRKQKLKKIMA